MSKMTLYRLFFYGTTACFLTGAGLFYVDRAVGARVNAAESSLKFRSQEEQAFLNAEAYCRGFRSHLAKGLRLSWGCPSGRCEKDQTGCHAPQRLQDAYERSLARRIAEAR